MSEHVVMPKSDYVSVCDKIRAKTGSTEPIKSSELVEKTETVYQKGYEQGKSEGGTPKEEQEKSINITENGTVEVAPDEEKVLSKVIVNVDVHSSDSHYDTFWDNYQGKGNRINYANGFYSAYWNADNFYPKYDIKPTNSIENMFRFTTELDIDLTERLRDCGVILDTSRVGQFSYAFGNSAIIRYPEISFESASSLVNVFFQSAVVTIDKIKCHRNLVFNDFLNTCTRLENLSIEGEIGRSFKALSSPLTAESAKSIITHLVNYAGTENEFVYSVLFADSVWELLNAEGATAPGDITWEEYVNSIGWNK